MEDARRFEAPKPVAVGETIEVEIKSQSGQGEGIANHNGFTIFVRGAQKGSRCRARIVDVKRTYAIAEKE